jgi:hypothetical protein
MEEANRRAELRKRFYQRYPEEANRTGTGGLEILHVPSS